MRKVFVATVFFVLPAHSVYGDDRTSGIDNIRLGNGNFLDIAAHRFRKPLDLQWYNTVNGLRLIGASLNADRFFVENDLKLLTDLSELGFVRVEARQEDLHAATDYPSPTFEIGVYPFRGPIAVSGLATVHYEKGDADLGLGLTWGRRPWNFLHFAWVEVDDLFNQKNSNDQSQYTETGQKFTLEGAYRFFAERNLLRFRIDHRTPTEFLDASDSTSYGHESTHYLATYDYLYAEQDFFGFALRGFKVDKSVADSGGDTTQDVDYISFEAYWHKLVAAKHELTLGLVYDDFNQKLRDSGSDWCEPLTPWCRGRDLTLSSMQGYGRWFHPYSTHQALDVGLYVAHEERFDDVLEGDSGDVSTEGFQGKLRFGWEYRSADGDSRLQLNASLNLDELSSDPSDGGGITFQTVF